MQKFYSATAAVRSVREELINTEIPWREVYLMYDQYAATWAVTTDPEDIEKIMESDFHSDCDGDFEKHLEGYKVWVYTDKKNKERWPNIYRNYDRTLLTNSHLRGLAILSAEVSVDFSVSKY